MNHKCDNYATKVVHLSILGEYVEYTTRRACAVFTQFDGDADDVQHTAVDRPYGETVKFSPAKLQRKSYRQLKDGHHRK